MLSDALKPLPARLDHAVINVREDLDTAEQTYRRLGFRLTPRGHHSLGSSNHLAVFGENYLELLGFEAGQGHRRPELLAHPLGLSGLALRTEDAESLHASLLARAVPTQAPRHFSRPVRLAAVATAEAQEARFSTVQLAVEPALPGRVFFCQQHTPELIWHADGQAHPNGVLNIIEFVILADNPRQAIAPYQQIFGQPEGRDPGSASYSSAASLISFATPRAFKQRYSLAPEALVRHDHMAALVLQIRSLEQTVQVLHRGGIPFSGNAAGHLVVTPQEAHGLTLIFKQ